MLIAIELEQKLNKQQIFEFYANQVYLGQRGSFSINGFGEASRSYFGKDIKEITLPEAAMIAGIIQSPNYLESLQASRKGDGAAQHRAGLDGGDRRHHPRPGRRRQGHPAQAQRAQRGSQRRSLLCRPGQGHARPASTRKPT